MFQSMHDTKTTSYCLASMLLCMNLGFQAHAMPSKHDVFISRAAAANPTSFKRLHINGRAVSAASEPCLVSEGLLSCAIKKANIVTGGFTSLDDEYDVVQSFLFNTRHKTKRPTAVVVLTKTSLQDDSVQAERLRVSFELKYEHPNVGTWHWVQYGTQVQCARGDTAGKWLKGRCL